VLAAGGAVLGLGLALTLTHLLQSQLFGVSARDPIVFASLAPVLIGVVAAASYLPGRSASRLNPVAALRSD
jgi:putative ABC transport system permease protein